MPHDEWGNYYESSVVDTFLAAIAAGVVVGAVLSIAFLLTDFALEWPHDLVKACAISFIVPFLAVLAIGSGD